jgi:hypothetical protein
MSMPLYPWGKSFFYPLDRVVPRAGMDDVEKRKFMTLAGIKL